MSQIGLVVLLATVGGCGAGVFAFLAGVGLDLTPKQVGALFELVYYVVALLVWVPITLGAVVRRLNDIGDPQWRAAFLLVPCLNALMVFYLYFQPGLPDGTSRPASQPRDNEP